MSDFLLYFGEFIVSFFMVYLFVKYWNDDNTTTRRGFFFALLDILSAVSANSPENVTGFVNPCAYLTEYSYPIFEDAPAAVDDSQVTSSIATKKAKRKRLITLSECTHCMSVSGIDTVFYHPWLEKQNSLLVKSWLLAQRKCTNALFSSRSYDKIIHDFQSLLTKHSGFKMVYPPFQRGNFFFYFKQDKGRKVGQPSLFLTRDIRREGTLILDAKSLCHSPRELILRGTWISCDGLKLVYGLSCGRQDNEITLFVRDTIIGEDSSADIIYGCSVDLTTVAWIEGHLGFFYNRIEPHSVSGQPVCVIRFHRLKSPPEDDLLIYEPLSHFAPASLSTVKSAPDKPHSQKQNCDKYLSTPRQHCGFVVSNDGNYLLIEVYRGCDVSIEGIDLSLPRKDQSIDNESGAHALGHMVQFRDLSVFDGKRDLTIGPLVTLVDTCKFRFEYVTNSFNKFLFRTNFNGRRFRIVHVTIPVLDNIWSVRGVDLSADSSMNSVGNKLHHRHSTSGSMNTSGEAFQSAARTISANSTSGSASIVAGNQKSYLRNSVSVSSSRDQMGKLLTIGKQLDESWKKSIEYIPEHPGGGLLTKAYVAAQNSALVLQYLVNGLHEIFVHDISHMAPLQPSAASVHRPQPLPDQHMNPIATLPHPPCGAITAINCSYQSATIFYQFTSFSDPGSVFRATVNRHPADGHVELSFDQLYRSSIADIDLSAFVTTQEGYRNAEDGEIIPLLVFGKQSSGSRRPLSSSVQDRGSGGDEGRSATESPPRPCILLSFGAFGVSYLPIFSLPLLLFAHHFDGLVAVANVRGGGELGVQWHLNGRCSKKDRSISDLSSAAEHLIRSGRTTSAQLAFMGGTMGGLLVGACLAVCPHLFAAAAVEDGIFDLLRHHVLDPAVSVGCQDTLSSIGCQVDSISGGYSSNINSSANHGDPFTGNGRKVSDDDGDGGRSSISAKRSYKYNLADDALSDSTHSVDEVNSLLSTYGGGPGDSDHASAMSVSTTAWIDEIGCAEESEAECLRLMEISPLHNISSAYRAFVTFQEKRKSESVDTANDGLSDESTSAIAASTTVSASKFPAVLLCTSESPMVSPVHSYKMLVELQQLAIDRGIKSPFVLRSAISVLPQDSSQEASSPSSLSSSLLDEERKQAEIFGFLLRHILRDNSSLEAIAAVGSDMKTTSSNSSNRATGNTNHITEVNRLGGLTKNNPKSSSSSTSISTSTTAASVLPVVLTASEVAQASVFSVPLVEKPTTRTT